MSAVRKPSQGQPLCYDPSMDWLAYFHELLIPFLGAFALLLGKAIADHEPLSFDDSNDIALDLVLVALGAMGALYSNPGAAKALGVTGAVRAVIDAGTVDVFLALLLLYVRFKRNRNGKKVNGSLVLPRVKWLSGSAQLILGMVAVIWTIKAF